MFWIIIIIVVVLCYFIVSQNGNYWKSRRVPYFKSWPVLGEFSCIVFGTMSLYEHLVDLVQRMENRRYVGIYQFLSPTLLIKDPELIKQITVKDFDHFIDHRPIMSKENDPLFGNNLLALKGDEWKDMRSTLSPSFTSSKMKIMFEFIMKCSQNVSTHYQKQGGPVILEMKELMSCYANDVIASTAFGLDCDSITDPNNEFRRMGKEVSNFEGLRAAKLFGYMLSPKLMEFFKIKVVSESVAYFFRRIIMDTIKLRKEKQIARPDMIHLLMEAQTGKLKYEQADKEDASFALNSESVQEQVHDRKNKFVLTDDDIVAQAVIFFGAGFDTVSTTMAFMAYELAVNPDIQQRLQQEIDDANEEGEGKISYEKLLNLKYLDMVISETLRKWPPFPITDRLCIKEYILPSENSREHTIVIDKGVIMTIPIFGIHRNPQFYPDPDKFDPERFNSENKHNIHPFTFLPFGVGPRICIGMRFALLEIKCLFYSLLTKFDIVPTENTQIPLKIHKKRVTLSAEKGIWLELKKRGDK